MASFNPHISMYVCHAARCTKGEKEIVFQVDSCTWFSKDPFLSTLWRLPKLGFRDVLNVKCILAICSESVRMTFCTGFNYVAEQHDLKKLCGGALLLVFHFKSI